MATFQVPQFIEEKSKIIGFLTLPQFLYLAAAGGLSFAAFYAFNFFFWLFLTTIMAGIAAGLAFVKINGQSLPKVLQSALLYVWKPKEYIWQRALKEAEIDTSEIEKLEKLRKNMNLQEKIKSIALSITTSRIFSPATNKGKESFEVVTFMTGEKRLAKRVDY